MEIRLNKLISDSGFCSRREADRLIEMGRVTVNGQLPEKGQKIESSDIVMLDDLQIHIGKHSGQTQEHQRASAPKTKLLIFGEKQEKKKNIIPEKVTTEKKTDDEKKTGSSKDKRPGKYVTYNKYAAARKASRDSEKPQNEKKEKISPTEEKVLRDALQPKFGKSLSRSAVAQRMFVAPKSASLRKTSKNNPANKAKRGTGHNKPKQS